MIYSELKPEDWEFLDKKGNSVSGYQSKYVTLAENESSNLHIFVDEKDRYHFAIAEESIEEIYNPKVNGLSVKITKYRLSENTDQKFIDLSCSISGYIKEFTEIVREISEKILVNGKDSKSAVSNVINSWKSFWDKQQKVILSDEEQIGLLCELNVLELLCQKGDPTWALSSWKGPLGEKYDFVLSDKVIEVKGTRSDRRIHTINGINQLSPPRDKSLKFISFYATKTNNQSSFSLPEMIGHMEATVFSHNVSHIIKFRKLLTGVGYSPIHNEIYKNYKFDIYDDALFSLNGDFPKLTGNDLKHPLSSRIIKVEYIIDLSGLPYKSLDDFEI